MNIITQIATKITALPSSTYGASDCDLAADNFTTCANSESLSASLKKSVPFWNQAVVVFRVIAALFFLKQVFTIFKEVMAGAPMKAVKAAMYGAVGLFLLFDIGNTLYVILNLRVLIQKAITTIQETINKPTT